MVLSCMHAMLSSAVTHHISEVHAGLHWSHGLALYPLRSKGSRQIQGRLSMTDVNQVKLECLLRSLSLALARRYILEVYINLRFHLSSPTLFHFFSLLFRLGGYQKGAKMAVFTRKFCTFPMRPKKKWRRRSRISWVQLILGACSHDGHGVPTDQF